MAINIFKKSNKEKKSIKKEPTVKAETKISNETKGEKVLAQKNNQSWKVLKFPHVTEKSGLMASDNFYVFQVMPKANKVEIKKAIESEYKVNVTDIKIINIPRKAVQRGRIPGFKNGYKKACVKIKSGQKIDIIAQ
jgi:large subunit ribosomal protein L23